MLQERDDVRSAAVNRQSEGPPAPAGQGCTGSEDAHRNYARNVASQGFALLAHAINACNNPATRYRFGDSEREQFMSLCATLHSLIENGKIEPRSAAMAQDDLAFQRFVSRSLAAAAGVAGDDQQ